LNNEADEQDPDKSIPSIDRFRLALPEERSYDESWSNDINWEYMRYLSGTEIARLMGFPVSEPAAEVNQSTPSEDDVEIREFSFPSTCTMKQQWKLLGNSLNVRVAATIAEIGIQAMFRDLAKTSS
jgi:tRNA (cytosine38-C5)-methyltransferase